jgi:hypothetical protein
MATARPASASSVAVSWARAAETAQRQGEGCHRRRLQHLRAVHERVEDTVPGRPGEDAAHRLPGRGQERHLGPGLLLGAGLQRGQLGTGPWHVAVLRRLHQHVGAQTGGAGRLGGLTGHPRSMRRRTGRTR